MSPTPSLREHLRRLSAVAPESAAAVEAHLDTLEQEVRLLADDDPFRAFVIAQARESGVTQAVLMRLNDGPLADMAKADLERAKAARLAAETKKDRAVTVQHVLSKPAILALIAILSTVVGSAGTAAVEYVKGLQPAPIVHDERGP